MDAAAGQGRRAESAGYLFRLCRYGLCAGRIWGATADLSPYLTDKDKNEYIQSYLTEGDFKDDGSIKVFPVAKATELLVVNDTDWQKFAEATGTSADEFATIEGLTAHGAALL